MRYPELQFRHRNRIDPMPIPQNGYECVYFGVMNATGRVANMKAHRNE